MRNGKEQTVCEWVGVSPFKPKTGSKIGIALHTIGKQPINGLRLQPEKGTNGWYIWGGKEFSEAGDFFSPLHVEHIAEYFPQVLEYLNLPPGYRFLVDNMGYQDVWFDDSLLST